MANLKCPVCESQQLSPEVVYSRFEHCARFKYLGKMGTFVRKDLTLGADLARFCLDCGYVLFFAKKDDVDKLRAALKEKG